MNVEELLNEIVLKFESCKNAEIAIGQENYLKNQFSFLGIKSPERRELQKEFLRKENLLPKQDGFELASKLWQLNEREYQYFAMDYLYKYHKQFHLSDLPFFESLVTSKSWWDTVDFIAPKIIGVSLLSHSTESEQKTQYYIQSKHLWLQRTALLFQLKYKDKVNTDLLYTTIEHLKPIPEFFIQKAIGWVLREYAKTNPSWVLQSVEQLRLEGLAKREALKHFV